jgi:blue copper oxidase
MKRRDFVSLVSAAMGTTLVWSCRKDFNGNEYPETMDIMTARGGGSGAVQRWPLKIPRAVSPNDLTLESKVGTSNLGGGLNSVAWTYKTSSPVNGYTDEHFPGPSIVARPNDPVTIRLMNSLNEETITHWHGLIVDHHNDGQPMMAKLPGEYFDYNFSIHPSQRASLNFYHPHPHMLTGKQVYMGQTGAFIIRDNEEDGLQLPTGNYEIPLILRDATLDKSGNLSYKPASGGMFGKIPLINGTRSPYLNVDRAVYRFRIVNGANSRIFGLALSNNANMRLIGNDGGLLPAHVDINRIDISNGERLDILFDFRTIPNNVNSLILRDLRAGWDLLEFRISNTVVNSIMPVTSSAITSLGTPVNTRHFSFDAMSKINGKEYDMDRIDWTVPFDTTEKWIFRTNGNAPHPVHVHGTSFQVLTRTGGRGVVYPWERGWKDTVLLEDGETVEVLIKFNHYRGIYLLHCHKLEHEDMGMMANFEVI